MVMIRVLFIARYPIMRPEGRLITGIVANNRGNAVAPFGNHHGKRWAPLDQAPMAMLKFLTGAAGTFFVPSGIAPG